MALNQVILRHAKTCCYYNDMESCATAEPEHNLNQEVLQ